MSGAGPERAVPGVAPPGPPGGAGTVAVTVNGDRHEVAPGTTVAALLDALGTEPRGVAVAVDGEVVSRSSWSEHELPAGAQVEILSIARGG